MVDQDINNNIDKPSYCLCRGHFGFCVKYPPSTPRTFIARKESPLVRLSAAILLFFALSESVRQIQGTNQPSRKSETGPSLALSTILEHRSGSALFQENFTSRLKYRLKVGPLDKILHPPLDSNLKPPTMINGCVSFSGNCRSRHQRLSAQIVGFRLQLNPFPNISSDSHPEPWALPILHSKKFD